MTDVVIRAATPADCDELLVAHTRAIRELCKGEYSETQRAAWAGRLAPESYLPAIEQNVFLIAELNGHVVGFGELSLSRGEILAIYIHPEYARRGIGTHLFRELEHIANAHGIVALKLSSSLGAVPFYERFGFVPGAPSVHRLGNGAEIPCVPMVRPAT